MGRVSAKSGTAAFMLPRSRLVERIRATPSGGICLLSADDGYGRRTLLGLALGADVVTLELADRALDAAELRALITSALGAVADDAWLVVLGLSSVDEIRAANVLTEVVRANLGSRRMALTCAPELASRLVDERIAGRLIELDQEDLHLDRDESLELLAAGASALGAEECAEIATLCDGWLRALVAVCAHLRDRPERHVLTWLRTYGAELLFGRWLETQDDDVREMLLQTAILEELTPELVDAVTQSDVGWTLPTLARPRGPIRVSPRSSEEGRVWFERHPLLTCLVRYQAAGRGSQDRHRRAAVWYRSTGDLGQELVHLLSAGDAERAVTRFHQVESEVLLSGTADLALRWYEQLPVSQAAEHLLRVAWAHALASRIPEARQSMYRLRALLDDQLTDDESAHPPLVDLGAEVDLLDAWLAERAGDVYSMVNLAERAQTSFGSAWATNAHQLATLLIARGRLLIDDVQEADRLLTGVRHTPFAAAVLGEGRRAETEAAVAWSQGNVHQARIWSARHDRWLRTQKSERIHPRFTPSVVGLLCAAEEGNIESAVDGATAVADIARDLGDATESVVALLGLAHLRRMQWRLSLAWEQTMLARATVLESSPEGGLLVPVTEAQVRIRLMSGDHTRAERLLKTMPASTSRQLLSARLALVRAQPHAMTLVREIDPTTVRVEVERGVLTAWAHSATSRRQAEQDLLRVADLAGQFGITSALIDAPESLLQVARRAAAYHVHDPLQELVRTAVHARTNVLAPTPAAPKSDLTLTRGELELLALLPTRATYGGMAEHLGVSVNTVKTRLRRLYAKLGASDREAAISQATRLGLLTRGQK
jgi:LuxR family maltose regulon positive regulatory protein